MAQPYDIALKLLAALAIGLLIGIERGWSEREESALPASAPSA